MIASVDELEYECGYPTPPTIQKLYDQLDLQRAAQAYLDFIPAMSMQAVLDAHPRDYGVSETGPAVVEVPPKVLSIINDGFMRCVADLGNAGLDRG